MRSHAWPIRTPPKPIVRSSGSSRSDASPKPPSDVRPLVNAVLRTYARALGDPQTQRGPIAWATFVRAATLLYFAFDLHRERYADPRWRRAALTVQQIALENADLIVCSRFLEAS